MKRGSIGIDVGGSKTLFALFDEAFDRIDEIKIKTPGETRAEFTDAFVESIKALVEKAEAHRLSIQVVGVGCAGSVDSEKAIVHSAPNIPALKNYSFAEILKERTNAKVRAYNDVNSALYGELRFGAAVDCRNVVAAFIGTGVGGAIAIDGKVYLGASGHAGDLGHLLVEPYGVLAGSKRHGMLDELASRTAIASDAAALAAKNRAPYLLKSFGTDLRNIKSAALAKSIRNGDKAVEELVRTRARLLGIVLSNIIAVLNPQMLLLGGGLTNRLPSLIRKEVEAGIKAHATDHAFRALRVVASKLKNHAVTIGAAKLALDATGRASAID